MGSTWKQQCHFSRALELGLKELSLQNNLMKLYESRGVRSRSQKQK